MFVREHKKKNEKWQYLVEGRKERGRERSPDARMYYNEILFRTGMDVA